MSDLGDGTREPRRASTAGEVVDYAVVGLGHIAQVAVLPAFQNASASRLAALVSGDPDKRRVLSERYRVERAVGYDEYEELLASGVVDAVYIAVPNHLHAELAVRAAEAGVHVLCEKPLAVTEEECRLMIEAAAANGAMLMTAYRLHFEEGNMAVADAVMSGRIGEPRFFDARFSQDVAPGNIRLMPCELGGGPVYDMGIYCINAARYLFRSEPLRVRAAAASGEDPRFRDCDEMVSAILEFPRNRIATFTCSFAAEGQSEYRVVGTDGWAGMDPAFGYAANLEYTIRSGDETWRHRLPQRDQFAPELTHFSQCILRGEQPEPDGSEGLADVRIVRAIHEAAREGSVIDVSGPDRARRPGTELVQKEPGFPEPEEVHAAGPKER